MHFGAHLWRRVIHARALGFLARAQTACEKFALRAPPMNRLSHRRFDQARQRLAFAQYALGGFTQVGFDAQGGKRGSLHDGIALRLRRGKSNTPTFTVDDTDAVLECAIRCLTNSTEICTLQEMKTTLDINNQLLADAKALAAQQRTSLTRLIEEGLQLRLRAQATAPPRRKLRLPVHKGRGGLVAGVDPLSNKALLEALGDDA